MAAAVAARASGAAASAAAGRSCRQGRRFDEACKDKSGFSDDGREHVGEVAAELGQSSQQPSSTVLDGNLREHGRQAFERHSLE